MSDLSNKIKMLAGEYAHCYAFVGDDTMPRKQKELYDAIDEQQKQIDELKVRVVAITSAANNLRNAIDNYYPDTSEFSNLYVAAVDVIDSQPTTQSLAEHDARVIEDKLLDKPAKVGAGTFNKGIQWRLVVEAAQRQYEYHSNLRNQGEDR